MNLIEAKRPESVERCPATVGPSRIAQELRAFLTDESRTTAEGVEVVFFPENEQQLCGAVQECARKNMRISVAGARTGIVGGAVPVESEAVISMERINNAGGLSFCEREGDQGFRITVGAGLVLSELQEALHNTRPHEFPWQDAAGRESGLKILEARPGRLFYPVDPTEVSAQIGGTIATNASGARSYYYGTTREWVESLRVVTATGEILDMRRGDCVAEDGEFLLRRSDGSQAKIEVPDIARPSTKNTAGYYAGKHMDAVDLFIGSEGTLGIITQAQLRLSFAPPERLFATIFLPGEAEAIDMVRGLRRLEDVTLLAIEYIGPNALEMLRGLRAKSGASSNVPPLPEDAGCVVYLEAAFDGDDEFRTVFSMLTERINAAGGAPETTWAEFSQPQMRAMKAFRHAAPEAVNSIIASLKQEDPAIHKIGTDMAVPDACLGEIMALYRRELTDSGLRHSIFGHIGDNHLHVNILPASGAEMETAKELYDRLATEVVAMGGSVFAEHGVGRLKRTMLRLQFEAEELAAMERIKHVFDPRGLLNAGVIF